MSSRAHLRCIGASADVELTATSSLPDGWLDLFSVDDLYEGRECPLRNLNHEGALLYLLCEAPAALARFRARMERAKIERAVERAQQPAGHQQDEGRAVRPLRALRRRQRHRAPGVRRGDRARRQRRVRFEGREYPVEITDAAAMRKEIGRAVAGMARAPNAKGSGNGDKRIRIVVERPPDERGCARCGARGERVRPTMKVRCAQSSA